MGRGEGSSGARAGWACALVLGWLAAAGADVDTSTGLGDNTLTNSVVEEPEFTDVIQNVTVPAGRSVKLACSVKNLGSYK
ncbi:hypothetical protein JYU34_003523, partial [Plutella xylostella]